MGNICGPKDKDKNESKKSNNIDQKIREDQLEEENKAKLLLLGAGESGKSTIVKQMKIIHQQGFQDEERKKYVHTIQSNTLFCMTNLIKAMDKLGIDFENSSNKDFAIEVVQSDNLLECHEKVKTLWGDSGIQEAFSRRNEFQLYDSAAFYFDNIERITDENFVPNDQDILMTRVRTTGIIETLFEYEGINFTLVDVGGQRNERKKWIHCFQGVTAVIFCVSLSEYDQNLFEDSAKNRMTEAIMLFEEIYYDGGCDFDNASEYIKDKFLLLNRNPEKEIYPHFTCATDTDNIKFVFSAVKDIILQRNIKDIGMI